jgi:hypothetical protein
VGADPHDIRDDVRVLRPTLPRIATATVAYRSVLAHEWASTSGLRVPTPRMQVGPTDELLQVWMSYLARHRNGTPMATFITIGYGDRAGYDRTNPIIRDEAHRHDADLVERGVMMGTAGTPTQVRNHDDAEVATEGPYLRSELPVAGFAFHRGRQPGRGRRPRVQDPVRRRPGCGRGLAPGD